MENSELLDLDDHQSINKAPDHETLPNSAGILTLGILSIVLIGFIGLILSIICLGLSSGAERELKLNPNKYTEGSIKNARAGKVCGIIGMSIFGLIAIVLIFLFIAIG